MGSNIKKIAKYVFSFALAFGLVAYSCSKMDWSNFTGALASCRWGLVFLSLCSGLMAATIRGIRWNLILRSFIPGISYFITFNAENIGNISNMAIQYSGEFVRCGVVTAKTKSPYDKVLGTAALERVWDLMSLFLVFVLTLALGGGKFGEFISGWVSDAFHGKGVLLIAGLAVLFIISFFAISKFSKLDGWFGNLCAKIYKVVCGMLDGFTSCLKMDRKWLFFLLTIFIWGMYWLQSVLIINALQGVFAGFGLVDALCIMLIGSLASVLPAPGSFGTYHAIIQFALSSVYFQGTMGMEKIAADSYGMTYAIMAHETQALAFIILGLLSLLIVSFEKKKTK